MREVTINRKSWHYWFASLGNGANTTDFCAYVWSVIAGVGLCLGVFIFISLYAGITGLALGWLCAIIFNGYVDPEGAMPGLVLNGGVAFAALLFISIKASGEVIQDHEFLQNAYASFRDKICFKVRVE